MSSEQTVLGIDLGTTNSAVAVVEEGHPVIVPVDGEKLLPSVVGEAPDGTLHVGRPARNQLAVYPERTVRSIKRRMGEDTRVELGQRSSTPVEISAAILRRLKTAAEEHLGHPVHRAVITVPAYFSDAQRTATREAGEIAGLTVERIINEPTAAALCYVTQRDVGERRILVFDLGGGTFDVSVVRCGPEVTEVLASHGDTALGGDDMDAALSAHLRRCLEHQGASAEGTQTLVRLGDAAERAKVELSTESWVRVSEEHIARKDGTGVHLDEEIARTDYEEMIEPLLQRTRDSVQSALRDAGLRASEVDDIVQVGGATRTPRVGELLEELTGRVPRRDVDPELTVALGAALQGARIAGRDVGPVLVDVTPYSFGTSHFGELGGAPSVHCYKPIIKRNTPLPARQTEVFYTMHPGQHAIEVEVLQGEQPDARDNILLGKFRVEGLDPDAPEGSPILFDVKLDLDGILDVEVTERATGLRKTVRIEDAFRKLDADQVAQQRAELEAAMPAGAQHARSGQVPATSEAEQGSVAASATAAGASSARADPGNGSSSGTPRRGGTQAPAAPPELSEEQRRAWTAAASLLDRATTAQPELDPADRDEVSEIVDNLLQAMRSADVSGVATVSEELADVLFYLDV